MADCAQNCPVAVRVESLEDQLTEYQAQNSARHTEIFGRLNALEKSEAVQEVHYNAIMDKLNKDITNKLDALATEIEALKQKPAKRWEALVGDVIKLVVAAVVGFFLARAGLG